MSRIVRVLPWLGPVAFMVALVLGLAYVTARFDSAEEAREAQHTEIVALQSGLEEANARLEAEGEPPVPVPEVNSDGEVTVVPIPPTHEETAAAVATWFATHDLSLTSGYSAAMQAAVARYLSRNPPPPGKDGKDAPAPTDRQIAGAVAAHLMANPPAAGINGRGVAETTLDGCHVVFTYTDGATDRVGPICGKDGTNGKDGRGIVDTECHSTGDWIITYTDGTASTRPGPCRYVEPSPSPSPSPTPSITKGR